MHIFKCKSRPLKNCFYVHIQQQQQPKEWTTIWNVTTRFMAILCSKFFRQPVFTVATLLDSHSTQCSRQIWISQRVHLVIVFSFLSVETSQSHQLLCIFSFQNNPIPNQSLGVLLPVENDFFSFCEHSQW